MSSLWFGCTICGAAFKDDDSPTLDRPAEARAIHHLAVDHGITSDPFQVLTVDLDESGPEDDSPPDLMADRRARMVRALYEAATAGETLQLQRSMSNEIVVEHMDGHTAPERGKTAAVSYLERLQRKEPLRGAEMSQRYELYGLRGAGRRVLVVLARTTHDERWDADAEQHLEADIVTLDGDRVSYIASYEDAERARSEFERVVGPLGDGDQTPFEREELPAIAEHCLHAATAAWDAFANDPVTFPEALGGHTIAVMTAVARADGAPDIERCSTSTLAAIEGDTFGPVVESIRLFAALGLSRESWDALQPNAVQLALDYSDQVENVLDAETWALEATRLAANVAMLVTRLDKAPTDEARDRHLTSLSDLVTRPVSWCLARAAVLRIIRESREVAARSTDSGHSAPS